VRENGDDECSTHDRLRHDSLNAAHFAASLCRSTTRQEELSKIQRLSKFGESGSKRKASEKKKPKKKLSLLSRVL
jgi:hypothetical protein